VKKGNADALFFQRSTMVKRDALLRGKNPIALVLIFLYHACCGKM
jgi:hypothetical protein